MTLSSWIFACGYKQEIWMHNDYVVHRFGRGLVRSVYPASWAMRFPLDVGVGMGVGVGDPLTVGHWFLEGMVSSTVTGSTSRKHAVVAASSNQHSCRDSNDSLLEVWRVTTGATRHFSFFLVSMILLFLRCSVDAPRHALIYPHAGWKRAGESPSATCSSECSRRTLGRDPL